MTTTITARAFLVDVMANTRNTPTGKMKTFGELSDSLWNKTSLYGQSGRTDFEFDVPSMYCSVKDSEHLRPTSDITPLL